MEEASFLETSKELLTFIENSPTAFHVVNNLAKILEDEGYVRLSENQEWNISQAKGYYVTRGDSSIIVFKLPKDGAVDFTNFQITAAHSDSPAFKLKENPEIVSDKKYIVANVEKYGGMLMAPWFDRPLSVAGRVIVKETDTFETRLVNVDRDLCLIPNLAIHMNRDANSGIAYNAQKDMLPLMGEIESKDLLDKIIADAAEAQVEDIVGADLFLYNRMPGTIWGVDNEFISSPRLDDLQCAYSCVNALIKAENSNGESVNVCAVFDNEEVGSTTKQGADSTFLTDTLERIATMCGKDMEAYKRSIANSFMISADNAHGVHPNYTDKADPTNRPYLNEGIVVKYNANQKYTTDAVSASIFKEICKRAGVPVQTYVNRSDIAGGSTLGNISNAHISLNTVDIGLAQLSMHSPYETAGIKDTKYMIDAIKKFYETSIYTNRNGSITLR